MPGFAPDSEAQELQQLLQRDLVRRLDEFATYDAATFAEIELPEAIGVCLLCIVAPLALAWLVA